MSKALGNVWQLWAVGATFMLFMILFDDAIGTFVRSEEPRRILVLRHLDFKDGHFEQLVVPSRGTNPMQGNWSASIYRRDGSFVCGDGGNGTYKVKVEFAKFTPDDWTGGDCSKLIVGREYLAVASWTFGTFGDEDTISGEITFTYSEPGEGPR